MMPPVSGRVDLHNHVLHGIDDGPATIEDSLAMGIMAARDGTRVLAATPHVREDYPGVEPAELAGRVAALDEQLSERGVDIRIVSGGEVALVDALERPEAELRAVTLGANGRDLLVETPHHGLSPSFEDLLAGVSARGFRVVLAHPEISRELQRDPERLGRIADAGVLVQVTASALGAPRSRAGRLAWRAIGEGWVHVLASDAHSPSWRPPTLAVALDAARAVHPEAAATLEWMVTEAPRAILAGEPLPPRPPLELKRRSRWRRLG